MRLCEYNVTSFINKEIMVTCLSYMNKAVYRNLMLPPSH